MINTQNTQLEIYRDGHLDQMYAFKQRMRAVGTFLGHVAYVGLETTVNVLDELVQAAQ